MQLYKNANGSGIRYFKTGKDFIILEFEDGNQYLYNNLKPGKKHVDAMKILAEKGSGLNTYINKNVRNTYAEKL